MLDGSVMVNITVDKAIDLGSTQAASILDSIGMDQESPTLYIPSGYSSISYFIDKVQIR